MTRDLRRIVYFSRSDLPASAEGAAAEIRRILEASRRNNPALGVTGALIFSRGAFGQLLEGPPDALERLFERIQADPRHREVTLLDYAAAPAREFPEWSMAYVGDGDGLRPSLPPVPGLRLDRLDGDGMLATLHRLAREHQSVA
jgi:hypothetical protein